VQGLGTLSSTYTIEEATITLPTPSRVGYIFSHWEKATALGVADNQILTGSDGDVAFKAGWEPIRYRITYDAAGNVNDAANLTTFTIEDEIKYERRCATREMTSSRSPSRTRRRARIPFRRGTSFLRITAKER
jgi:hypothetical protein